MSKKHWLYRVMSEETAKKALENNGDGVISLALRHPIAWNPSPDVQAEYARFIGTNPRGRAQRPQGYPWRKPTERGIADPTEGAIGPHTIMEPMSDGSESAGFVQIMKVQTTEFVDPRIRAICFSYFFGTEEELLDVMKKAQVSYKPSLEKDVSHYLYGEVESVLRRIHHLSDLPMPSYWVLAPVSYFEPNWSPPISMRYQFPWSNASEWNNLLNTLSVKLNLFSNTKLTYPSEPEAKDALDRATRALVKLADPYAIEKEVRLLVYSPEFNAQADHAQWELLSHTCKIEFGDALTLGAF